MEGRPIVFLPAASADYAAVLEYKGALKTHVERILWNLKHSSIPLRGVGYYDHPLVEAPLDDFGSIYVFPRSSAWFDSNHRAGCLRLIYRHYDLSKSLDDVYSLFSKIPGAEAAFIAVAEDDPDVSSWEEWDECIAVVCLCRGYHLNDIDLDSPYTDKGGILCGYLTAHDIVAMGFNFKSYKVVPQGFNLVRYYKYAKTIDSVEPADISIEWDLLREGAYL